MALAACGGGGGGNGPAAAPTASLTASANSVGAGQTVTLTWTSSAATSCTASGGWSGTKQTSGSAASAPINANTTFTLTCSGAGGSATANATVTALALPTVTFSADQTSITQNFPTTLRWSTIDATECSGANSGGASFNGAKRTSGIDSTGIVTSATTFTLTCIGPGGSTAREVQVSVSAPPADRVVVSGRITYDRIPFDARTQEGLDPGQIIRAPARGLWVYVSIPGDSEYTHTDVGGYFAMLRPMSVDALVIVRSQMQKVDAPPYWNFRVLREPNGGLYAYNDNDIFNTGTQNTIKNLHIPSGWNGNGYTQARSAAPFAILDTVYDALQLVLSADPDVNLPTLDLYWNQSNRPSARFCPSDYDIGTTFYFSGQIGGAVDECATPRTVYPGIYILGDFAGGNGDTDEFDAHVIAREFGHFIGSTFSRFDSLPGKLLPGEHSGGDRLDPRVAFREGFGNAFGAMALNDSRYRDSFGGMDLDFGFDMESEAAATPGWFSEASVSKFLWDVFDDNAGAPESRDSVALGFGPIYSVLTGPQLTTDSVTSIFSFATALREQNSGSASALASLLQQEDIDGSDEFGNGETNDAGDTHSLPVYAPIVLNTPKTNVCSSSSLGSVAGNKLGNHRLLRFENDATRLVTITVMGSAPSPDTVAATNPNILVLRRGNVVLSGTSNVAGQEMLSAQLLAAGSYVLDVYDVDVADTAATAPPRCMTVSIAGN